MKKFFSLSSLIFILISANIYGQELQKIDNVSTVGISAERLQRIDMMISEAIEAKQIPGAVSLISRNGKIVHLKAYGNADASGRALKVDDIFRIASQTKAITSTAVMMLWEEGKFQLDDPISKYIPEFSNPQLLESFNENDSTFTTKPAGKEITKPLKLNRSPEQ